MYLPKEDLSYILQADATLWESLRDKKIFVTGGTGFFGKWLLESFAYINSELSLNAEMHILTRNPDRFIQQHPLYGTIPAVKYITGDVMDFSFPNTKYDFIIHAATAADAEINRDFPLLMLDTITQGTRRVFEFAAKISPEAFLLTSSGAVYGKQPSEVTHVKESDGFFIDINNPVSAYAEGKRLSELYASIYYKQYNVPVKIARCFAFVGPYLPLDKHFAIGNFILDCLRGNDIQIKGDGTPFRSYLYAADLTYWLWKVLITGKINTPYNIGSADEVSIASLAHAVGKFNPEISVTVQKQADPSKPVERYVPDVRFIMQDLGISGYTDITASIHKTLDFYGFNFKIPAL